MGRSRKQDKQKAHFLRRVRERFGLYLEPTDVRRIVALIREGKTECIEKQSNRITVHDITYGGEHMHVCYDKQRGELVTALLPEGNPLTKLYR